MENKNTVKALPVYVFTNKSIGDCSNDGISSRFDRLFLACESGHVDIQEDDPRLLRLVKRELWGKVYLNARPVNPGATNNMRGPMFGGNFVFTSDSRFPSSYPIPVHDRYEMEEIR